MQRGELKFTQRPPWHYEDPARLIARTFPPELAKVFEKSPHGLKALLTKFWVYTQITTEKLISAFREPIPLRLTSLRDTNLECGSKRLDFRGTYEFYVVFNGNKWVAEVGSVQGGKYKRDVKQYAPDTEISRQVSTLNLDRLESARAKRLQEEQLEKHPIWMLWGSSKISDEEAKRFIDQGEEGFSYKNLFADYAYDFFEGIMGSLATI